MALGFFMILVDTTIVSVANPAIKAALDPETPDLDSVVWVTSAYLLAFAVPLLVTGRMGDRFGIKNMYLIGLAIFTLASLWCGLSDSLLELTIARAVQGLGAACVSPQSMAIISRTFAPHQRGSAMALWGATAGMAMIAGPLLGGVIVAGLGWEWIFFVNLPVGVIGIVLAILFVPKLEIHSHRFDIAGVLLSAVAMFLIVFSLQEGEAHAWGPLWGPVQVWMLLLVGIVVLGVFIWHQARTPREPLVPLGLFRSRSFSWSGVGVLAMGFTVTSQALPIMFFFQSARGLTPMQAALLLIPSGVCSALLAPVAGRILNRYDPRFLLIAGVLSMAGGLFLSSALMRMDTPIGLFLLTSALLGTGSAFIWAPLAMVAIRDLPLSQAGAGSGVYNTMRTVGSVLGSAAIAAFMQSRLVANVSAADAVSGVGEGNLGAVLPPEAATGFAAAMSQAILLPAVVVLLVLVAAFFLPAGRPTAPAPPAPAPPLG